MGKVDELRDASDLVFQALARDAGQRVLAFSCVAEWIKDDARRLHIVRKYEAPAHRPVVLKFAQHPRDQPEFAAILSAMHRAHHALSDHPTATVPKILAQDAEAQAYLMTYFQGDTLLDLCRKTPDHRGILRAAGTWLAGYHAGTFTQERPFQPRFMVNHMAHLSDQMRRGDRRIANQQKFLKYADGIAERAQDADGHLGKIAAKHGDLNAHNLLIGGGRVAALDFLGASNAPVGYDIARLLLSYVQMVGDIDAIPKGQVISRAALDAFFEGYTFLPADDPTVDFLMRVQILTDWNRMENKSRLRAAVRFARLKEIARRAFA